MVPGSLVAVFRGSSLFCPVLLLLRCQYHDGSTYIDYLVPWYSLCVNQRSINRLWAFNFSAVQVYYQPMARPHTTCKSVAVVNDSGMGHLSNNIWMSPTAACCADNSNANAADTHQVHPC